MIFKTNGFWKLSRGENMQDRQASLLELFFDVIIVVLLGGAINGWKFEFNQYVLTDKLSILNMTYYLLQVTTVLFLWRNYLFYTAKYEMNNIRHRFFTMVLMLSILFMDFAASINVADATSKINTAVVITNFIGITTSMLITGYLHLTASITAENKYEKVFLKKAAIWRFVNTLLVAISFILYGLFTEVWIRWISLAIWMFMLLLWSITAFMAWSSKYYANTSHVSTKLIQERYAVLLIIFLGEMIIQLIASLVANATSFESTMNELWKLVVVFVMIFAWWWIFNQNYKYPELIDRPSKINLYTFSMIFVFLSIVFSSTSLNLILSSNKELQEIGKYVLAFGISCWYVFATLTSFALQPFNIADKWIMPKSHRKTSLIISIVSVPILSLVFIPSITGLMWLGITAAFSVSEVISIELSRYIASRNNAKNVVEFNTYLRKSKQSQEEWYQKNIKQHIDFELHKSGDFKLNTYSQRIKPK